MNKADREKHEGFVLAELALGGKLEMLSGRRGAAPKYLRTIEDVVIELPSTAIARALIDACKVVRKACEGGWFITPKTPFDAKLAGKRRTLYQIDIGAIGYRTSYNTRYDYSPNFYTDKIKSVIHIVTPFGVFGQCGVRGTHESAAVARMVLKAELIDHLKKAQQEHRKAINSANDKLVEARRMLERRIENAGSVEVSDE